MWHLSVPACRTLRGLATHLSLIGLAEVWQLCRCLGCGGLIELTETMWWMIKEKWTAEDLQEWIEVERAFAEYLKRGEIILDA